MLVPGNDPIPSQDAKLALLPLIREFYDRGNLWLFEDPQNLRDLLRLLVPELADRLDFARARRENRSFIPADLQEQESDLIVSVPFLAEPDREIWIYLLLEHQSKPDPAMGLRLYLYMSELWKLQQRGWEDKQLPPAERRLWPIVPLVFYTGEGTWSTPIGLKHLMDLPAVLEPYVPAWETPLLCLHETSPETLTEVAGAVGWALRVLQAEKAPLAEIERVLTEAMAGLEGLSAEQAGQWKRVAWFLLLLVYHRREERELVDRVLEQAKVSKFREREEVAAMGLTVAEQMKMEAKREDLETVLTVRFGPLSAEIRRALAAATVERINTWLRAAAAAETLDEVGIQPGDPHS